MSEGEVDLKFDIVIQKKGEVDLKFDIVIQTKKGALYYCLIKRSQGFETASAATNGSKQMSLDKAHHLLVHAIHRSTIDTAKKFGWGQLKNSDKACQCYAKASTK